MVGRLVSFWDGLFSGAMLVSGSVHPTIPDKLYQDVSLMLYLHMTSIYQVLEQVTQTGVFYP